MKWSVHLDGGPRRVNHAAALIGDKIYSFGGYCSQGNYDDHLPIDVFVLDTNTLRWKDLPVPHSKEDVQYFLTPYQRYGHTVVAYSEKAYLWGGRNDSSGSCNVLFEYSPRNHTWRRVRTTNTPPARDGHSACVIGDAMYIFGGFEQHFDRFSNEIYRLDLQDFSWTEIKPTGQPPTPRDFHSATAIGHKMYIFGGRSPDMDLQNMHSPLEIYDPRLSVYDTQELHWSHFDPMEPSPCGRRSHSSYVYDGKMYVFGGFNGDERAHLNDMYRFDPASKAWSRVKQGGELPVPRRRQCCVVHNDRLFMFGGTSPVPRSQVVVEQEDDEFDLDNNLMDRADLHVFEFDVSLKTLSLLQVLQSADRERLNDCLPWNLQDDLRSRTIPNPVFLPTIARSQTAHEG